NPSPQSPPTSFELPPPPTAWDATESPPPKRRRGTFGVIGLAVVLVAGALAFVVTRGGDPAEARPLALSFEEGASESYRIHMTMDGTVGSDLFGEMPLQMEMSQVTTWRVTSVAADGTATIDVSTSEVSGSVSGIEIPAEAAETPPIEIVVAPDGRVVSAGGFALGGASQTQGFGFPGMGQLTPILPEDGGPVAPGDSWEREFSQEFPFGEGTISYEARSTYERNEVVDGRDAAVIVTDLTVPIEFTLRFRDMIEAMGEELGDVGATGVAELEDASIAYAGGGTFTQTSWVDLQAQELLRMRSDGEFELSMEFGGVSGFEGEITFDGSFTQDLERVGS
ncbi:MAG TPA: hypothetical protein VLA90_09010, partial [Actinomycetota bacterium]|nr:hypothetical protein [Actinomycetota bacterium]